MAFKDVLNALVDAKAEVQIQLRAPGSQPLGPGKLEKYVMPDADRPLLGNIYRITIQADMKATAVARPQRVLVPILFCADDVICITEAPIAVEGEKIVTLEPGSRTPSGLHIPGHSG